MKTTDIIHIKKPYNSITYCGIISGENSVYVTFYLYNHMLRYDGMNFCPECENEFHIQYIIDQLSGDTNDSHIRKN